METEPKKYLSEFTLMPEGTQILEDFLQANRRALCDSDQPMRRGMVQRQLQELLRQVIPTEVLAALRDVFAGTSDHVIAIHGFPERQIKTARPLSENFYSYYISKALFSAVDAHHITSVYLKRERFEKQKPSGMNIHRDTIAVVRDKKYCEYIIFSSPHNVENAATEFIHLRDAIESIPEEMRARIKVDVTERQMSEINGTIYSHESRNLNEVLTTLANKDPNDLNHVFIKSIALIDSPESPEGQAFLAAIEKHGVAYNIQPGSLLVLNESTMFHRAHRGNVELLPREMEYTRYFLHHAGAASR